MGETHQRQAVLLWSLGQASRRGLLANQLRMARKNLTESTWIAWTEMARERFS